MFTGEYTQEWLQWGANEMVRRVTELHDKHYYHDLARVWETQQARATEVGMTEDQVLEAMVLAKFKNVLPTEYP